MRKFFILQLIFSLLLLNNMYAQIGRYFSTDGQLSSAHVSQIYQVKDGYILIATNNGLNVYDGYRFQVFKNSNEKGSIGSNVVNCIVQGNDGMIYLGLSNGVQYYANDRFNNVTLYDEHRHIVTDFITYMYKQPDGSILISCTDHGIFKLKSHNTAVRIFPNIRELNSPTHLVSDSRGWLWVVTNRYGIIATNGRKVVHFFQNSALSSSFSDICIDRHGDIYAANLNGGLYRIRRGDKDFKLVSGTATIPIASLDAVDGVILIGTNGKGLMEYSPAKDALSVRYSYNQDINTNHGKVYSILKDKQGNIWTGLLQKGVFMMPVHNTNFMYMGYKMGSNNSIGDACVMSVYHTLNGKMLVATDNNGLFALDDNGALLRHYMPGVGGMPSTIVGMTEDSQQRLWVGTWLDGCGWIDLQSGTYHRMEWSDGKSRNVFDVKADKYGNMWIGTLGNGLKRMNINSGIIAEYHNSQKIKFAIQNDYINQLSLSPDGNRLYVATSPGMACLDIQKNKWIPIVNDTVLQELPVFDMKEDYHGRLWICTPQGLYCINLKTHAEKIYTTEQGLADDNVTAIEIDGKGNIWVSTRHGMSRISSDGKIENYFVGDGLQGNEFCEGCSYRFGNRIFFGGMNGITWFDINKMSRKKQSLKVFLTGLIIGDEYVRANNRSGVYTVMDTIIAKADHFNLSHQDNNFSIMLSTFSFDNPEGITYYYSINGEEWQKLPQGKNTITFSRISPGVYKFRVKAVDNGISSDIKSFTVHIHNAWYFSLWAKMFYLLLLIAAVWRYLYLLKRRQQTQLRLQEHIHAEELNESKLRFFMNISHEIRTPLTLIVAPLQNLMKQDDDIIRQGLYRTIKRNAERILHLINEIMDLRKIDKGQMVMHLQETDLIGFTQDIFTLFDQQAKSKQITFRFTHDADKLPIWIDKANFDKVLINILSNAFKFTHIGGNIVINISHDDRNATIDVYDDGDKIPEDRLDKIFQRFVSYDSSPYSKRTINSGQAGTGIGLDLTRSLVELHHGSITAKNNEDKGCTFSVIMPLGNAHLRPEEMIAEDEGEKEITNDEIWDANNITPDIITSTDRSKKSSRPTIVVVEDDDDIRKYLAQELSNDYRVVECVNGMDGLKTILNNPPQLVISDVMMPEMDGNTLVAKIKSNINTNHIPVILLTAKSREEDQLEGLEAGADAYIMKPFNMDILRREIYNLLSVRNMLRNKFNGNESQKDKIDDVAMESPDDKLLERIMAVVNKNIDNEDLNVEMIADAVGLSRVHLYRKMKELTNQSPSDFVRNIRLKQAANLLARGHQSIADVMYACGFSNRTSFSTLFRKMYGMTPHDYMIAHEEMKNNNS